MRRILTCALGVFLLVASSGAECMAQGAATEQPPPANAIFGEVVDDASGLPLASASVVLATAQPGFVSGGEGAALSLDPDLP